MKLRNIYLALTSAALLPTFAYAGENWDVVGASFDRDINREYSVRYVPATVANADPLNAINDTLFKETDLVLASFVRDLYRAPVASRTFPDGMVADPLDEVNIALSCENSDIFNARFFRDMNRC